MTVEAFWKQFLEDTGRDPETKYYDSFHFCLDEKWANELLHLVLIGQKRATSSSVPVYEAEGERLPEVGDMSVVTDWDGNPHCVIRTTGVTILPFREMTYDICKREGEDECLETWREGHIRFFTEDCAQAGVTFTEDMPVLFEDFEVIYKL